MFYFDVDFCAEHEVGNFGPQQTTLKIKGKNIFVANKFKAA